MFGEIPGDGPLKLLNVNLYFLSKTNGRKDL